MSDPFPLIENHELEDDYLTEENKPHECPNCVNFPPPHHSSLGNNVYFERYLYLEYDVMEDIWKCCTCGSNYDDDFGPGDEIVPFEKMIFKES